MDTLPIDPGKKIPSSHAMNTGLGQRVERIMKNPVEQVKYYLREGQLAKAVEGMREIDNDSLSAIIADAMLPSEMRLGFVLRLSERVSREQFLLLSSDMVHTEEFDDKAILASFELSASSFKILRFTDGSIISKLSIANGYIDIGKIPSGKYRGYYYGQKWDKTYDLYSATGVKHYSALGSLT